MTWHPVSNKKQKVTKQITAFFILRSPCCSQMSASVAFYHVITIHYQLSLTYAIPHINNGNRYQVCLGLQLCSIALVYFGLLMDFFPAKFASGFKCKRSTDTVDPKVFHCDLCLLGSNPCIACNRPSLVPSICLGYFSDRLYFIAELPHSVYFSCGT